MSDFESFIGSLNDQGYLLKKGSRVYQLQTLWAEPLRRAFCRCNHSPPMDWWPCSWARQLIPCCHCWLRGEDPLSEPSGASRLTWSCPMALLLDSPWGPATACGAVQDQHTLPSSRRRTCVLRQWHVFHFKRDVGPADLMPEIFHGKDVSCF